MRPARERARQHNRGYIKKYWWMPEDRPWLIPIQGYAGVRKVRNVTCAVIIAREGFELPIPMDAIWQKDSTRVLIHHKRFEIVDFYQRRLDRHLDMDAEIPSS